MNYLSAQYANAERTSAVVNTDDCGAMVISRDDAPDLWDGLLHNPGIVIEEFPGNTPEGKRAALKAAVTKHRWKVESGGITLPGGARVLTRIEDQNRISNAVSNALRMNLTSVRFKNADGEFVDMPVDVLVAIADAVALHVQACFDAEAAHYAAIDELVDAELDDYNVKAEWPN